MYGSIGIDERIRFTFPADPKRTAVQPGDQFQILAHVFQPFIFTKNRLRKQLAGLRIASFQLLFGKPPLLHYIVKGLLLYSGYFRQKLNFHIPFSISLPKKRISVDQLCISISAAPCRQTEQIPRKHHHKQRTVQRKIIAPNLLLCSLFGL